MVPPLFAVARRVEEHPGGSRVHGHAEFRATLEQPTNKASGEDDMDLSLA
jgi:hypothetical protein